MKEEIIKTLIELYTEYLENSTEERTHNLTNLESDSDEKKEVVFKGDLDGFMYYLLDKQNKP